MKHILVTGDGAYHIAHCVQRVHRHHFVYDRITSLQYATAWPPRSPDFKAMVYCDPTTSLFDLKENVERYMGNIP